MSNIDKQALREAAEKALPAMKRLLMMPTDELFDEALLNADGDVDAANAFNLLSGPETMLGLLDEIAELEQGHCGTSLLEREEMHAKTVGRLLDELEARDKQIDILRQDKDTVIDTSLERINKILSRAVAAEKRIAELQSVNDELKKFPDQIVSYVARLGTSEIGSHTRNVIYRAAQKVKDSAAGIGKEG